MMLIILNEKPDVSVEMLPKKIKFKQLIELSQMLNSEFNLGEMKVIPQGKCIRQWIRKNKKWVFKYYCKLYTDCVLDGIKFKRETLNKLLNTIFKFSKLINKQDNMEIKSAIFRYKKDYNFEHPTDTELPISEAVSAYKNYVVWKGW